MDPRNFDTKDFYEENELARITIKINSRDIHNAEHVSRFTILMNSRDFLQKFTTIPYNSSTQRVCKNGFELSQFTIQFHTRTRAFDKKLYV